MNKNYTGLILTILVSIIGINYPVAAKENNADLEFKTQKDSSINTDPSHLFLVTIYNQNIPVSKEVSGNSVEEILMYNVMKAIWKEGKWVRYIENVSQESSFQVGHPSMTNDGKTIFFIANMPGGFGGTDIYYSELVNNSWTSPHNLGSAINTKLNETYPVMLENNRLRYLSNGGLTFINVSKILNLKSSTNPPAVINKNNSTTPVDSSTNVALVPKLIDNVYRITLGGFKTPNWEILNQFKVYGKLYTEVNENGITLVRLGDFTDIAKCKEILTEVHKRKWFENASIYLFKNGKYIKP